MKTIPLKLKLLETSSTMQINHSIRILSLLILTLGTVNTQAQSLVDYHQGFGTDFGEFKQGDHFISLSGNYYANSSFFTNSFVNLGLGTGRYISEEIKDDFSAKLSENNNRFGTEAAFQFEYKKLAEQFLGKDSMAISIGYSLRDVQYMKLSKDAVDVYFRGNAPYAGETKYADARVSSFYFNQIRFGLEHVVNGAKWGIGTSLLLGVSYQNINMGRGELYTDPDGDYIDFNTAFDMAYIGDVDSKFYEINGAGLSFDFNFQKTVHKTDQIDFSITDLGFIIWGNAQTVEADTNIHFEGAEVANAFNFNEDDYAFPDDSLLDYFGLKAANRSVTQWLPTTFTLSYYHEFTEKIGLTSGVRYMITPAYFPKLFLIGSYGKREKIMLNATASFGGYGNFLGGLGLEKLFAEKIGVNFNFYMFGSTLYPSTSTGQAADIKIYAVF